MADVQSVIRIVIDAEAGVEGASKLNNALDSIVGRGGRLTAANDNAAGGLRRLTGGMSDASRSGGLLGGTLGTLEQTTGALLGRLGGLNSVMGTLAFAGAAAGAVAFAGALTAAKNAADEYQDVLAKISTNVDTATFNMGALSKGILEQSAAMGGMPKEEAEAAYDIISAGAGSAAQALDILQASNNLAVGGMTKVGVAADGLTSVINAYGAANLSTASASDAMFIAARDGKTTIDQLSASLGNVAPIAAATGVNFDELTGAIGVLTKGGINTRESVTGLKAIISSIVKPSEEAKKAAKSIGLEWDVAALKAKGLRGVLQDMAAKTQGSTAKMAVLAGGVEALVPALALTARNGAEFATTMDHMRDKAGATAEAVKKMQDGSPSFQAQRVSASFTAELIKLGQTISQMMLPVMRFLADHMQAIFAAGKAAAMGLTVFGAAAAGMKISGIVTNIIGLEKALGATGTMSAIYSAGMKMAQGATNSFTAALLANPITGLIAALTVAATLLYQFRDSIMVTGDGVTSLGDLFRAAFEGIPEKISNAWNAIKNGFSSAWDFVKGILGGVGTFLYNSFSVPLDAIGNLFSSTFGDLDFSFEGVLVGAARVADGILGVFVGSFKALVALWNGLPQELGPNIMAILGFGKAVVVGIWNAAKSVWNALAGVASSIGSGIASAFNSISSFIEKWANKAIDAMNLVIGGANKLGAGINEVGHISLASIAPPKSEAKTLGGQMGDAFADGFGNTFETGVKGLFSRAKTIGRARTASGSGSNNPTATLTGGGDDSGFAEKDKPDKKSKAEQEAERRAKAEKEFWATLKGEAETAALLPLAAENHRKELELQKILGRDLAKTEVDRVATAMTLVRNNKFATDATQAHLEAVKALSQGQSEFTAKASGQTEEQIALDRSMYEFRNGAEKLGVDLRSEAYRLAAATRLQDEQGILALKERNKALENTLALAGKYSTTFNAAEAAKTEIKDRGNAMNGLLSGQITKQVYDEIVEGLDNAAKAISVKFYDDFADKIGDLSQYFGGKLGESLGGFANALKDLTANAKGDFKNGGVVGSLFSLFGTKTDGTKNTLGQAASDASNKTLKGLNMESLSNPLKSMSAGFGEFKTSMGQIFGKGGSLTKGLGSVLGAAGAGMQIGQITSSIAGMVGIKLNKTGSQIGGALGSIGGPMGSVAGSVLGGIVGNLFSKPKEASSGFSVIDGVATAGTVKGNGKAAKGEAGALAGSVAEQLNAIATSLGGSIGSLSGVSVGYRPGHKAGAYRVDENGTGKLTGVAAFETAAEAVAYAVKNAIQDGSITGLSDVVNKALTSLGADAAVAFAKNWQAVLDDYSAMTNPMKAAVDAIIKPLDSLKATMVQVGASSSDLAKLEEYRSLKLDAALKQQTQSFLDILDQLNGDAGGVSALTQLNNQMGQYSKYQKDIAAGKTVNQDDYSDLVGKILGNASNLYGSQTGDYQAIVEAIKNGTTGALTNATNAFNTASGRDTTTVSNDPSTASIASNTAAAVDAINSQTAELVATLKAGFDSIAVSGGYTVRSVNGQLV